MMKYKRQRRQDMDALFCYADMQVWATATAACLEESVSPQVDGPFFASILRTLVDELRRSFTEHAQSFLLWNLVCTFAGEHAQKHPQCQKRLAVSLQQIRTLFGDSPSFHGLLEEILCDDYSQARAIASEETGQAIKTFPAQCPWDVEYCLFSQHDGVGETDV